MLLEEAGYSLLGPVALNCAAPDEGNIHLLHMTGTPEQQAKYLAPLVAGDVRSCFSMTEPPPGAGSDPMALRTRARRVAGGWVVNGEKWLITGAEGAAFSIVMALNEGDDAPEGATMFERLLAECVLNAPTWTLRGGTTEVLRGIAAKALTR